MLRILSIKKITPHICLNRPYGTADYIRLRVKKNTIQEYIHKRHLVLKTKEDLKKEKKPSKYDIPLINAFEMEEGKNMSIYDFLYDWLYIITPIIILTIIP
jgi:hypothetical protein